MTRETLKISVISSRFNGNFANNILSLFGSTVWRMCSTNVLLPMIVNWLHFQFRSVLYNVAIAIQDMSWANDY